MWAKKRLAAKKVLDKSQNPYYINIKFCLRGAFKFLSVPFRNKIFSPNRNVILFRSNFPLDAEMSFLILNGESGFAKEFFQSEVAGHSTIYFSDKKRQGGNL